MLLHGGDREEARNRFAALWSEIGAGGAALHRCTLARYLADVQDDPGDALAWDLRALAAADAGRADRAAPGAGQALRALYPSLHLDLALGYLRLHHPEAARLHLGRARGALDGLGGDDGHARRIRTGIDELARRLEADPG
ncbi:hypothetical protein FQU76_03495 [Streptomyces qinzhouensis]|uniref:Tetratricopeptide repeat protein n=2 Tax=Streptomyces qinzhouensis TaxID=2599401 RepID=A0A5B8JLD7_9ACTN|nr:hypothetical protein FQU76_03495 [Streptomyces qinzhouensis]